MATWLEAAEDSLRAARMLQERHPRSSISRYYYAAYAACCEWLDHHHAPTQAIHSEQWYSHERLARGLELVAEGFAGVRLLDPAATDLLIAEVKRLQKARVDADYHPEIPPPETLNNLHRDARSVVSLIRELEGEQDE